jgi:hypothetical protein
VVINLTLTAIIKLKYYCMAVRVRFISTNKDGKENEVSFAIIEGNGGFLLEYRGGRNRLSTVEALIVI